MSDTLKLFCLVYGDTPSKHAFSVKIPKTDTIDELKKLIKKEKSPELDHFATDKLELWKVNIPMSKLATLDGNFEKEGLSPFSDIGDIFFDPPRKHLHIIVLIPTMTELFQPEKRDEKSAGIQNYEALLQDAQDAQVSQIRKFEAQPQAAWDGLEQDRPQKSQNDPGQLTNVQKQLVEQNSSLKKEVAVAERKLNVKNERIQTLETLLQDAQEKLISQNQKFEAQLQAVRERLEQEWSQKSQNARLR